MGRRNRKPGRPQAAKRVWVEPVHRKEVNKRKLARAVLRMAMEQSERNDATEASDAYTKNDQPNEKEET
jgi:hypothetical protein